MDFGLIAAKELDQYVRNESAFIIDLRTPEEYRRYHLRGAVNIPYERLESCLGFPEDRILILYCGRGAVSMAAARRLAARGYRVKTVIGGIHAYRGSFGITDR